MSAGPGANRASGTQAAQLSALLAGVRAGDEATARDLVERLYSVIAPVVRAHLPRRDESEDLMQEVFLKMFSRLEQYRGEVAFERWVARIALNTCLDRLRRQRVRPELRWADLTSEEQAVVETLAAEQPPADADAPNALALVEKLLADLPPADAWLLRQVELEERAVGDVCAETGWSPVAARVRLFRARKRLQAAWRKLEGERM
jgi:RNA polymerase sigma-70 factor (ECF subfamily)